MKSKDPNPRPSPARKARTPDPKQVNQATATDFEREGMGVAPKE